MNAQYLRVCVTLLTVCYFAIQIVEFTVHSTVHSTWSLSTLKFSVGRTYWINVVTFKWEETVSPLHNIFSHSVQNGGRKDWKMATKANAQGYDVSNTTVYSKDSPLKPAELDTLTCPACKKVLKEPVQVIACGHRFCKGCISALTSGRWGVLFNIVSCWNIRTLHVTTQTTCEKYYSFYFFPLPVEVHSTALLTGSFLKQLRLVCAVLGVSGKQITDNNSEMQRSQL